MSRAPRPTIRRRKSWQVQRAIPSHGILLSVLAILASFAGVASGENWTVDRLRDGMLAERQQLRQGIYRITGTNVEHIGDRVASHEVDMFGAFDALRDTFRFDRVRPNPLPNPRSPELVTKVILAPDRSAYYNSHFKGLIIQARDAKEPMLATGGSLDIRALSVYTTDENMFGNVMLPEALDKFFRSEPTEIVAEGDRIVRIRMPHRYFYRDWWIDVENGYTPIRMNQVYTVTDVPQELLDLPWYTIDIAWKRINNVTVPIAYRKMHRRQVSGERLPDGTEETQFEIRKYDWNIAWESINEPVDPNLFDYIRLDLRNGTHVADGRSGKLVVREIIGTPPAVALRIDRSGIPWTRVLLILIANGAAILAILAVIVIRRRRR